MSWQLASAVILVIVILGGLAWFERSRPSARLLAAVAALAALAVAGRVALAPVPNVVATTDVALLAGYTLGGAPGFAVGALAALISNFWLGQGPWTPWQMAGWGLIGVGGAALAALSARRLGRIALAAAAAAAGLLYGALLDLSTMVSFGGEQSLDRYLALSARAVPFNLAHAAGNAALMLVAGPALVRMLTRYRERSEVVWDDPLPRRAAPASGATAILLVLVAAGLLSGAHGGPGRGLAVAADARAAASSGPNKSAALRWLARAQNADGGWGTSPGASSNPGMTGWAMLGLAGGGRNPRDVTRGGNSGVDYLRRNAGSLRSTGDLERTILALRASGVSARALAGRDLVAELRSRRGSNGSYENQVNLTAFAVLALAAAGEQRSSLSSQISWLREAQNDDGGWGSTAAAESEPDSTGAALQALALAAPGASGTERGARWLAGAQKNDGGWSLTRPQDSNAQSTAWAVQGLLAARHRPGSVRSNGRSGLDYLGARQRGDGHLSYSRASDQTPVWVTGQALPAVSGRTYPLAPVPRRPGADGGGGGGSSTGSGAGASRTAATGGPSRSGGSPRAKGGGAKQKAAAAKGAGQGGGGRADKTVAARAGHPPIAATPAVEAAPAASRLPGTPVMLGGLGALALALGAGWLLYRRKLP